MSVLILTQAEVEALLPMPECIERMAEVLSALGRGELHQPLRMVTFPPGAAGAMALMPSYRGGASAALGLKIVNVFPANPAKKLDAHQGAVLLFSGTTGQLQAILNASAVTAIRTAAVSGVATRLLARPDAGDLAIVGAGVQARSHLEAMACVRPLRRVRVASRDLDHARRFAAELAPRFDFPIEPLASVEAAVRGADLVVTATNAKTPVLRSEWIAPGAHINAVGSSVPNARELDGATVAAAALFVDRRESTIHEAGDYLFALREGAIGPDHIRAELGELLLGQASGRRSDSEITLFKSLGLAVEDLAAAEHVYQNARSRGIGRWVEF